MVQITAGIMVTTVLNLSLVEVAPPSQLQSAPTRAPVVEPSGAATGAPAATTPAIESDDAATGAPSTDTAAIEPGGTAGDATTNPNVDGSPAAAPPAPPTPDPWATPRATSASTPPIAPPLSARERANARKREALRKEPMFNGNGLLIGTGVAAAIVIGSGVGLAVLRAAVITTCDIDDNCWTDNPHPEWSAFSGTMFTMATLSATATGIAGGVLRGRHDAWRVSQGTRRPPKARLHMALGGSLIGVSATLFAASITSSFSTHQRTFELGVPLFATAAVSSMVTGFGMLSHGAGFLARQQLFSRLAVAPMISLENKTGGLSLSGRF